MSLTHACPKGMIWDPKAGMCISIIRGESKKPKKPAKKPTKGVNQIYGFKK